MKHNSKLYYERNSYSGESVEQTMQRLEKKRLRRKIKKSIIKGKL